MLCPDERRNHQEWEYIISGYQRIQNLFVNIREMRDLGFTCQIYMEIRKCQNFLVNIQKTPNL